MRGGDNKREEENRREKMRQNEGRDAKIWDKMSRIIEERRTQNKMRDEKRQTETKTSEGIR